MPLFFFNVNGVQKHEDREGEEFPDKDAAWHEATLVAGEMFKDIDGALKPGDKWTLDVSDENHVPIFRIQITSSRLS